MSYPFLTSLQPFRFAPPANYIGGPGQVIQYTSSPSPVTNPMASASTPTGNTPVSNSGGAGTSGFVFSPPPLVLGGQNIPTGLSFDLPLAGANTDAAAQAYDFASSNFANGFNFETNAANSTTSFVEPILTAVSGFLQQIGTINAQADLTAAGNSGSKGGSIICTVMQFDRIMPRDWALSSMRRFNCYPKRIRIGYWRWSLPIAKRIHKNPKALSSRIVCRMMLWRAENLAAKDGVTGARRKRIRGTFANVVFGVPSLACSLWG